jgi:hypothetical protein
MSGRRLRSGSGADQEEAGGSQRQAMKGEWKHDGEGLWTYVVTFSDLDGKPYYPSWWQRQRPGYASELRQEFSGQFGRLKDLARRRNCNAREIPVVGGDGTQKYHSSFKVTVTGGIVTQIEYLPL